jgi:hypothetical protein
MVKMGEHLVRRGVQGASQLAISGIGQLREVCDQFIGTSAGLVGVGELVDAHQVQGDGPSRVVSPVGSPAIRPVTSRARASTDRRSRRRRGTRQMPYSGRRCDRGVADGVPLDAAANVIEAAQA